MAFLAYDITNNLTHFQQQKPCTFSKNIFTHIKVSLIKRTNQDESLRFKPTSNFYYDWGDERMETTNGRLRGWGEADDIYTPEEVIFLAFS